MITALLWLACAGTEPSVPEPDPVVDKPAAPRGVAIVYSHDLDGEIEPCG